MPPSPKWSNSATKRFADATEEMRRTAGSIKSELDVTRAELKKGVIEMPEEAKESTTAIRRAVSEQINALKELSEIVAKSGRSTSLRAAPCVRHRRRLRRAPRAAAPSSGTAEPPLPAQAPSGDDRTARRPAERPAETRRASATIMAARRRAAGCAIS